MNEETREPTYYAIIPAEVRYAPIPPNAKLLYGEITALSNKQGYCWASNLYFAKLYKVSGTSVSLWVKQLIDHKFIKTTIKNTYERKIYLLPLKKLKGEEKTFKKSESNLKENLTQPLRNLKYNNTSNTTNNNIDYILKKMNEDPKIARIKKMSKCG